MECTLEPTEVECRAAVSECSVVTEEACSVVADERREEEYWVEKTILEEELICLTLEFISADKTADSTGISV